MRGKRTSIAAVRAKFGQIDTFQTPLLSHCRLPLRINPGTFMPRSVNYTVLYIYDFWSFFPFSQISLEFVALIEYIYYTEPILTIFSVSSEYLQNRCFSKCYYMKSWRRPILMSRIKKKYWNRIRCEVLGLSSLFSLVNTFKICNVFAYWFFPRAPFFVQCALTVQRLPDCVGVMKGRSYWRWLIKKPLLAIGCLPPFTFCLLVCIVLAVE